jgi:superfamily II DNA/RNA helicase
MRTKHQAKKLAKQLTADGIPAVDLHGNLGQGARERNLEAFSSGTVKVLVATDIAARGIHVDDVALVVHADPPAEAKAYLHRSGRTARAGAAGTVITLMTQEQTGDVRAMTRAAGITPTVTRIDGPRHPMLTTLAPGERVLVAGGLGVPTDDEKPMRHNGGGGGRNRGRSGGGRPRSGAPKSSSGQKSSGGGNRRRGQGGSGGKSGGQGGQSSSGRSHSASSFSTGRR